MIHPWHILDANRMLMSSWQTAEIDSTAKLLGHVHLEGAVRIGRMSLLNPELYSRAPVT